MNWHNLSEQEFDTRLKEYFSDTQVPFDPISWGKMEQKLDVEFTDKRSNGRSYGLVLIALLLSSLFFWNVGSFPQQISSNGSLNVPMHDANSSMLTTEANNESVSKLNQQSTAQTNQEVFTREQEELEVPTDPLSGKADRDTENTSSINPASQQDPDNTIQAAKKQQVLIATNDQYSGTTDRTATGADIQAQESKTTNTSVNEIDGIILDTDLLIQQPDEELPDSIEYIKVFQTPPIVPMANSPWLIGVGFAPDISLVGFGETTKPGTNFSLAVEYQLHHRWSLNFGVTYSHKNYKASGDDYHPPEGFWDYGVQPDDTDATCNVIDIPINIRYYLTNTRGSRIFASTGISSYLMLSEEYDYEYHHNYNPNLVDSWSVSNENQHYFSIYNLSIGYQKSVGAHWFVEIEPFIKVPLAGVGFGEVDLWSTGSSFSLKYNFK